jgi:hypothetical protein
MNRFTRKLISLLGIVAVVFAQLAVSAHACPMQFMGLDDAMAATGMPAADASESNAMSPALCQKHCENAQQSVNDTPQAAVLSSPEPVLPVALLTVAVAAIPVPTLTPSLLHATSPPHAIRNCCFRI